MLSYTQYLTPQILLLEIHPKYTFKSLQRQLCKDIHYQL